MCGGNVGDLLPDADPPDVTVLRIEPASEPEDLEVTESGETSRSDTVTNTHAQRLLDQLALCLDNLSTAERERAAARAHHVLRRYLCPR